MDEQDGTNYSIIKPDDLESTIQETLSYEGPVLVEVFTNPDVPVLPPHSSLGVLSRYVESQAKLAAGGRFKDAWLSIKTSIQYVRDLW